MPAEFDREGPHRSHVHWSGRRFPSPLGMGSRGWKRHRPTFKIPSAAARQGRPDAVLWGQHGKAENLEAGLRAWTSAGLAVDNRRERRPDADVTSGRRHSRRDRIRQGTFRQTHAYVNHSVCTPPRQARIRRQVRLGPASGHPLPSLMLDRSHARFVTPAPPMAPAAALALSPKSIRRPWSALTNEINGRMSLHPPKPGGHRSFSGLGGFETQAEREHHPV